MDNSYYTGATLIRGSHHHNHTHPHSHNIGHGHAPYHHQQSQQQQQQQQQSQQSQQQSNGTGGGVSGPKTSLAGPPLLMQPRNNKNHLFSGAPLIRNGPQQVVGLGGGCGNIVPVSPTLPNQSSPHPPGVICCFQPVYYVPMQPQQNPSIHQLNSPSSQQQQQQQPLALLPPPMKKMSQQQQQPSQQQQQQQQQQGPKRRNYKSLQIPTNKSQSVVTMPTHMKSPMHSNLIGSNSNPILHSQQQQQPLISPNPIKKPNMTHPILKLSHSDQRDDQRHVNNDSPPIENIYCHSTSSRSSSSGISSSDENDTTTNNITSSSSSSSPFQSSIESTRLINEEKQRSDKLLNFYFYDEHWRPREAEPTPTIVNNVNSNHFDYNNNDLNNNGSNMETSNDFDFDWGNNNMMAGFGHFPTTTTNGSTNHIQNSHHHGGNNAGIIGTRLTFSQNPTSTTNFNGTNSTPINNGNNGHVATTNTTTPAMVVKKKDLEVEAQIVTLANGHRDLEIRLCYVTS